MRITNENIVATSLKGISPNSPDKNMQNALEKSRDYKHFDRYEGVSFNDDAIALNDNSSTAGIFSENASLDVGDIILKSQEIYDGNAPDGFSAKHIISGFFRAEGGSRYSVGIDYEIADKLGTEPWIIDHGMVNLAWATENGTFNEDSVATIAAQVGKYIDHCYENGKYTDEEYAQLNDEIKNCTKYWLDQITDARVGKRLRDEDAMLYSNPRILVKSPKRTAEDYLADKIRMRKIIEAENPFDFDAFFKKIEQMRFNVVGIKSDSDKNA